MKEQKLKTIIGWIFLICHFGTFISIIVFSILGGLDNDDAKMIIGVILPMFAVYTTAIIKAALIDRRRMAVSQQLVNAQFASIALVLVSLFALSIPALVFVRVASWLRTQDVVFFLGLIETAFAIYLGMIVNELYGNKQSPAKKSSSKIKG